MVTAITMKYGRRRSASPSRRAGGHAGRDLVHRGDRWSAADRAALGAAIEQVDAATSGYPAYYMINCAHPSHFEHVLVGGQPWTERIRGLRANASARAIPS